MKLNRIAGAVISALTLSFLMKPLQGSGQAHLPAAQRKPAAALLSLDPVVRTGRLANGFTYYIRRNTEPQKQVIFYLANKVGSVLEDDDQQGLAHFMEHMNFNGTRHYPKNELVDYLQKAGVRFGADINAYTGFDETVYQLPLPSDKPDVLEHGIQIMRDWAQEALLDPIEIDKERGVVLEEKRLGKGAQQRMQQQYLPVMFNHSRFAYRLPIGEDSILNHFTPATLRRFYHNWYRPDLQALIVVGDIDVDRMEQTIKTRFADLVNPANELPRTPYSIPLTGGNQFIAVTDKEQTSTALQVMIMHKALVVKTVADYRQHILRSLFNSMLAARYQELQQYSPPFVAGDAGINPFQGGLDMFSAGVVAKPGALEPGFKAVWREVERVKKFGFTATELNRAKDIYLSRIESTIREGNKAASAQYVQEYLQYFLKGVAATGIAAEYALVKKQLPGIGLPDVNVLAKEYIRDTNRYIIIMAPDKDKDSLPGEAMVNGWLQQVRSETITPYKDGYNNRPLMMEKPLAGTIIEETPLEGIHATRLRLSNGATVIVRQTDFANDEILFRCFAPGGSSIYADSDYLSASYAAMLVTTSGLGPFTGVGLNNYLASKSILMGPSIDDYTAQIQGYVSPKYKESLFQMLYLYFTHPKMDTASAKSLVGRFRDALINGNKNPSSIFRDTVEALMNNYNPRRMPLTVEKLDQVDPRKCLDIFKQQFSDASNFTFCFIGNTNIDSLRPFILRYIASLPSTHSGLQYRDLQLHPPAGIITKTVYRGLEPKATVRLTFSGQYQYSATGNLIMDALSSILEIRLLERLREEESGVYSPQCFIRYNKRPDERYVFTVEFGCAPQNAGKLIASVLDEVNKLKTNGPDSVNIEKFKAENRHTHELKLRENFFWTEYIMNQAMQQEDINEVNGYENRMQQLNKDSIRQAARRYLDGANMIRIALMPENVAPAK